MLTLSLRRTPSAQGAAAAMFLPGDDVISWFDEIATWGVPLEQIRFYLCPTSVRAESTAGVLAVPPDGTRLPENGRGIPFRRQGQSVYLPIDSELWPPISDDELTSLARFPVTIVHPSLGVTGCEEDDMRRAENLLCAPPLVVGNWTAARHGPPAPPGLKAVRLAATLTLAEIFGPESGDIGSESPDDLPPLANEPSGTSPGQIAQAIAGKLAQGLLGLTALVPRTKNGPQTWINGVENWARRHLAGRRASLEHSRHRELHRLLEMLKRDPEAGLRHAIPLAALAHRGKAPPGGRLLERRIDFSLGRLGGGRAADFWNIPAQMRTSLAQQYRDSAMRELRLGRHRRAAYIFAELLADFSAAADALRQGRHFHEAAVLYRERLRNPIAAAGCLVEAGLYLEAIELYEAQQKWLDAADVYVRMGDASSAEKAARREVKSRLERGDVVAAARLLEERLGRVDEALHLLREAWPRGKQAPAALEERMAMLQRQRRDEELRRDLKIIAHETTPPVLLAPAANVLAKVAESSTDAEVRALAENAVRIKVATGLTGRVVEGPDEMTLLRALTRLAPGDKVLVRDVQRFRDTRRSRPQPPSPTTTSALIRRIELRKLDTVQLPRDHAWVRAIAGPSSFTAAGVSGDGLLAVVRFAWGHPEEKVFWRDPAPERGHSVILAAHVNGVIVGRPMAARLPLKSMMVGGANGSASVEVGMPEFLPEDTVAVAHSRFSVWALRVVQDRIVLDVYESQRIAGTYDVTDELLAAGATGGGTALSLASQQGSGGVALGYGQHLLVRYGSELKIVPLGSRITNVIAVQAPQMPSGWIVTFDRGATFVSVDGKTVISIDDHLVRPRATLTGDHRIVLVGEAEGMVAQVKGSSAVRLAWFSFAADPLVTVLPTETADVIATLGEDGAVVRWRIPTS